MARIFKQTYTKPLPANADVFTRKGKRYARFKDGRGKTITAPLSQDCTKIIREASKWYIEYRDADGQTKRVPGFTDKKATEQHASELERQAEQVRSGYRPKEYRQLNRPLREHLSDFRSFLESKGDSKSHVSLTVQRARRVFDTCEFIFWRDISASRALNCIAGLKHHGKSLSNQTMNQYIKAIKQFCRWMVQDGRAGESPVENLQELPVVPTFERRAGTPDELRTLLQVAQSAPRRFRLAGNERAVLYRFAAETGLRAKEIRELKVSNFDFDRRVVVARAGCTKNKDKAVIPLREETAALLRDFLREKVPSAQAFRMPSKYKTAEMLRADLSDAGIPYEDELGRRFDFHALRHTFITSLRSAPLRVVQALARHKSSRVTDRYTHIELFDERAVIEGTLPDYSLPAEGQRNVATGTDGSVLQTGHYGTPNNKLDNKPAKEGSQVLAVKALTNEGNRQQVL